MSLDVVMLTKDHPEYVSAAMRSMQTQGVPFQGYLLDNSTDSHGANLSLARAHGWRYLTAFENLSYSRGNNWGVAAGAGERVLLLNDDAVLRPGCVAAMLEHDDEVVGGLMVQTDGRVNHAGVHVCSSWGMPDHIGRGQAPETWRLRPCETVFAVTFAAVLIRRATWEALGGLDERYEWSYEDTDLCLRVRERGGAVVACRRAEATHNELGTRTGANDLRNLAIYRDTWERRLSSLPEIGAIAPHTQPLLIGARDG